MSEVEKSVELNRLKIAEVRKMIAAGNIADAEALCRQCEGVVFASLVDEYFLALQSESHVASENEVPCPDGSKITFDLIYFDEKLQASIGIYQGKKYLLSINRLSCLSPGYDSIVVKADGYYGINGSDEELVISFCQQ